MKITIRHGPIDETLAIRSMDLDYGDIKIRTPIKTTSVNIPLNTINESFSRYTSDKLSNITRDSKLEKRANYELKVKTSNKLNFAFSEYTDETIPDEKLIYTMSDLQYSHSDVATTPLWSGIIKSQKADDLKDTLIRLNSTFIDAIESRDNKTIFGVIPWQLPRGYLLEYIGSLVNRDVTSFVVNFNNSAIDSNPSWLIQLFRTVKGYSLLDRSMFYALNANEGKFSKKTNIIPAKDFFCCGFDFDVLGLNHTPLRGDAEFFRLLKQKQEQKAIVAYRDFDPLTYGYIRKESSDVELRMAVDRKNIMKQFEEAIALQVRLKKDGSVNDYILTKKGLTNKMIHGSISLRSETYGKERPRQTTLI